MKIKSNHGSFFNNLDIVNAKPAKTELILVTSNPENYRNASCHAVRNEFQLGLKEFRPLDKK